MTQSHFDLVEPIEGLTVFPDPSSVFAEPVARYRKHLQPLISIDLCLVDPNVAGKIHLLNPVEPYDGYLAEETPLAHTEFCKSNWLGCQLDQDNRYVLLADFDFFALDSSCVQARDWPDYPDDLNKLYAQAEQHHTDCQYRYQRFGGLYPGKRFDPKEKDNPQSTPSTLIDQLGGKAPDGNWADGSGVMHIVDDPVRGLVPRPADINDFYFVASATGYHYRKGSADWILLFYSPGTRIALHTFDWT